MALTLVPPIANGLVRAVQPTGTYTTAVVTFAFSLRHRRKELDIER